MLLYFFREANHLGSELRHYGVKRRMRRCSGGFRQEVIQVNLRALRTAHDARNAV
jgi:hypothetical protein